MNCTPSRRLKAAGAGSHYDQLIQDTEDIARENPEEEVHN